MKIPEILRPREKSYSIQRKSYDQNQKILRAEKGTFSSNTKSYKEKTEAQLV